MPTMSNLSSDYRNSSEQSTSQSEKTKVMITYSDGSRFQYEIEVPTTHEFVPTTQTELQYWYSSQKFIIGHEFSHSAHGMGTCVSDTPTYINMANVSQIRELSV